MEIIKCNNELFTIKKNGVLLHSKYNPIREAETFSNSSVKGFVGKNLCIIGLALGYHVLEILKVIDNKVEVKVFEEDKEILNHAKKYGVLQEILRFKNVKIISDNFSISLANELSRADKIIIYKPSIKVMNNLELKNVFENFDIAQKSTAKNYELLNRNYEENKKTNYKIIDDFIKKFNGDRIIVVAAGPSLDLSLDEIKKNRNKVKIISVGSALKALINYGIVPDAVVIIDGQEIVKKQLKGYENEDFPLLFLNTASRWAVNNFKGHKYMFFNEKTECSNYVIETGKTVAMASLSIAVKCGFREIIMAGQDLAYLNNKHHSQCYEDIYGKKQVLNINDSMKKVESVNGEILYTNSGYLYFKTKIERLIDDNKSIRFINCSNGAGIIGAIEKDIKEALQEE